MKWESLDSAFRSLQFPEGKYPEILAKEEVPELIEGLRAWYPDMSVGSECRWLSQEFYFEEVFSKEGGVTNYLPVDLKDQDRFMFFMAFEKDENARTISSPMAAVATNYHGLKLAQLGPLMLSAMGEAMGAELAFFISTLKVPQVQRNAEKAGFKIVGIIPAFDRDLLGPGKIKRVYEAIYAKVLLQDLSGIELPSREAMTPATKALFDFLFKT